MSTSLTIFERWGRILNLAGVSILPLLVIFITADVVGRKLLVPLKGGLEISELGVVTVIFFAFAYTQVVKGHVGCDVLSRAFLPRTWAIIGSITGFVALLVFLIFLYAAVDAAVEDWQSGLTSGVLRIPIFPFKLAMAFGIFSLSLVLVAQWIQTVRQALSRTR